jgi:hypothetical protein
MKREGESHDEMLERLAEVVKLRDALQDEMDKQYNFTVCLLSMTDAEIAALRAFVALCQKERER